MFLLAQGLIAAPLPGAFPLDDQPIARPILMLFILVILALAPFLVMMMTSFVKIAVVFSLLRNAMGTHQIPPNQIDECGLPLDKVLENRRFIVYEVQK